LLKQNPLSTMTETQPTTEGLMPSSEFQSHMPYAGLQHNALTIQQEKFVQYVSSGMTYAAAARASGYTNPERAYELVKNPKIAQAIDYFRTQMREEVKFNVVNAHSMYMDAYAQSATATEMKNTVDSLVKLHGLAKDNQPQTQVNVQINNIKQLERLTDEELLKIVGKDMQYLEPVADGDTEEAV